MVIRLSWEEEAMTTTKVYSTREAAKMLGITLMSLWRYDRDGRVTLPVVQHVGGTQFRAWKRSDVERVRKQMLRIKKGRKGAAR
jgi:predicted DNA-binding transcriptional regulator AlpA